MTVRWMSEHWIELKFQMSHDISELPQIKHAYEIGAPARAGEPLSLIDVLSIKRLLRQALPRDAAFLTGGMDLEPMFERRVVAPIASATMRERLAPICASSSGERRQANGRIGIAGQHLHMGDELAAVGTMRCKRRFDPTCKFYSSRAIVRSLIWRLACAYV
jgi:hypothetical protein